jgi:hypothetical protein
MPFGSSQWMYSSGFYPTVIDQSLMFDGSSYLSRTPSVAGDRKTWTWSGWVKRGALGANEATLFSSRVASTYTQFSFRNSGSPTPLQFFLQSRTGASEEISLITTQVFRDPSAWCHIVVAVDTTQATSTNRAKIYSNGSQITSFSTSTYPSQNLDTMVNFTQAHAIGNDASGGSLFDGYMADTYFVDGTALDPTSFGEFKSGVWIPKAYTGSYGTNGFHLEYNDNANDSSGTGNNWTATNIVAGDYMLDSPTNNFATLNPLLPASSSAATLSNGNLTASVSPSLANAVSSMGMSSGKFYWEFTWTYGTGGGLFVGIDSNLAFSGQQAAGSLSTGYGYYNANGTKENAGSAAYGSIWYSSGTYVIGVAFDATNGTLAYYLNNVSQGTAFTGIPAGTYYASMCYTSGSGSTTCHFNFGQSGFTYTPPTDFLALSTANLPEPSISPLYGASPQDHFNTVLYTGTGVSNAVTGVGFQPDLVWIKSRTSIEAGNVFDVVRGSTKRLQTSETAAEWDNSSNITSFDTDGFTLSTADAINASGQSFVGWQWKAGGTAVSNTEGTITSQVSANTTAGFSIVSYTGTGAAATVGHGLGVAPEMMIIKVRSTTNHWVVYHQSLGNTKAIYLSLTGAADTNASFWNNTSPTSSVFTINTDTISNANTATYIAYCFNSVEGYSKFGSYTGNGSADGPFVYTGFRPAWVMVKGSSLISEWYVWDAIRNTYNVTNLTLNPNQSVAEYSGGSLLLDLTANGFKLRDAVGSWNLSGNTYIYMAFASNPFKYANAR